MILCLNDKKLSTVKIMLYFAIVYLCVVAVVVTSGIGSQQATAKKFLDGKPTHEKQYVKNLNTGKTDSIYVRIKTK